MGVVTFNYADSDEELEVHVLRIFDYEGELHESEEVRPEWFPVEKIPYSSMWPDDFYWLPLFLKGKKFHGHFHFRDKNTIESYALTEL